MPGPTGRADDPSRGVADWRVVLDLSDDPVAANTYRVLRDLWWPHPMHGRIAVERHGTRRHQLLVYRCRCGQTLGLPMDVARDLGIVA